VTALLLGGGAPTLTMQAGALAALHEHGVKFDIVSTAGAGMLIGLLYAAPKGRSPGQALAQTKEMGVHDSIYEHFPINFKSSTSPASSPTATAAGCSRCRAWCPVRPRRAGCGPTGWR
jgi:NTE family protein